MGATYKGFYLPSVTETNWEVAVNANFSITAASVGTLFLPAVTGTDDSGTASGTSGSAFNKIRSFVLTNAATVSTFWMFQVPAGLAANMFTVRPFWYPSVSDATAHSVRWQMTVRSLIGVDVGSSQTTVTWTGDSAARVFPVGVLETGQASTGVSVAGGSIVRISVARLGADALDTYVGNVNFMGVQLDFMAG